MEDLYGAHWSTGKKSVPGARSPDRAVYLPGRNMALSVKAAVFAAMRKIPVLALGSLDHNPFPDASPRFFKEWGKALGAGLGTRLQVVAPYRSLSKKEVIRRGARLPLHLSFSCISPKGKWHCGRCNKCAERRRAFRAAKVKDKTVYVKG
jgi:7-cyano-7-deazaguanine synthase